MRNDRESETSHDDEHQRESDCILKRVIRDATPFHHVRVFLCLH